MATAGIVKSLSEQRRKIHYQFQHGKSPRCCLVICRYTVTAVCRTSPTTNCSKRQNGRVILKCHFPLGFFLVSLTTTIIPGTTRQYTSDYRNIDMNLLTGKPTHKRQRLNSTALDDTLKVHQRNKHPLWESKKAFPEPGRPVNPVIGALQHIAPSVDSITVAHWME